MFNSWSIATRIDTQPNTLFSFLNPLPFLAKMTPLSFHFQLRGPVTSRPQEKWALVSPETKSDCPNESLNTGTTFHLQRGMAETTLCAKSQLEVNFHTSRALLSDIARFHTNMELRLSNYAPAAQLLRKCGTEFQLISRVSSQAAPAFKSRSRQSSLSGHLPSPPMLLPQGSHTITRSLSDCP